MGFVGRISTGLLVIIEVRMALSSQVAVPTHYSDNKILYPDIVINTMMKQFYILILGKEK